TRAFKRIGRAVLAADRLESPRTCTAGGDAFHLCKRAVGGAMVVNDAVLFLVGLHVEMSTTVTRHTHLSRHTHFSRHFFCGHTLFSFASFKLDLMFCVSQPVTLRENLGA